MQITLDITEDDIAAFARDGFLLRDRIIDDATVEALRSAMTRTFEGDSDTGLQPDEVNWHPGDDPHVTRQICNGWKGNRVLARVLLSREVGKACARLNAWPGARIAHDNILWKPPLADGKPGGALGMHQDSAFIVWSNPSLMCSVWIALDDVTREGGTIEFARGSHLWGKEPAAPGFHNPDDYLNEFRKAATNAGIAEPEMVPVEVKAGGGSIHHGWTWHGSGPNRSRTPRRSVVAHCLSSAAAFTDQVGIGVYSRYKRPGSNLMDPAYFPILWTEAGERSEFVDDYVRSDRAWHAA